MLELLFQQFDSLAKRLHLRMVRAELAEAFAKTRRPVRATYDAAGSSDEFKNYWANADQYDDIDVDDLIISNVIVDAGPTLKRFRARARGRGTRILKRTSHITVILAEQSA